MISTEGGFVFLGELKQKELDFVLCSFVRTCLSVALLNNYNFIYSKKPDDELPTPVVREEENIFNNIRKRKRNLCDAVCE